MFLLVLLCSTAVGTLCFRDANAQTRRRPPAAPAPVLPAYVSLTPTESAQAEGLYERLCLPCHGAFGRGDGPLASYLRVAPRDFTRQPYKWRSTPSGSGPLESDVTDTIARGVRGAGMPAFNATTTPEERALLARYVLRMQPQLRPGQAISPQDHRGGDVAQGEALFARLQCVACHGTTLRGDGPAAQTPGPAPYDLTHEAARGGGSLASLGRTLRTGLDGTNMPSFGDALSASELRSLLAFLVARSASEIPVPPPFVSAGLDGRTMQPSGTSSNSARIALETSHWNFPLAPQGNPAPQATPAERSLHPEQCGRCHSAQFTQFQDTVHSRAMGPGVLGQLLDMNPRERAECQRCHAPMYEQHEHQHGDASQAPNTWPRNELFDEPLRAQGIVCAACHLRQNVRMGPPSRNEDPRRLPLGHYPRTQLSRFERGDFCAPCHQHTHADSVAGMPVLDTVAEWTRGPYFARGVQCQHCHMSDREHRWRGAHDPETVRQAVSINASHTTTSGNTRVSIAVTNVGAGHAFPGTTTPAAVLSIEWLDAQQRVVGTPTVERFQRHLDWDGQRFVQPYDTRILPGATRTVQVTNTNPAVRSVRYTLTFRPDDYYEGFYRRELQAAWRSPRGRTLLQQALRNAEQSPFVVRTETLLLR